MIRTVVIRRAHATILFLFLTALACEVDNPAPFAFYVVGDWGRLGSPEQLSVAKEMNSWITRENPRFIISTGDNFYTVGVTSVQDSQWKDSFENVYDGGDLFYKPWYVVLGNHDYLGSPDAEIEYHQVDHRWNLPSRYYSRLEKMNDGTQVRFIFMDTSPFERSYYAQVEFNSKLSSQDTLRQKKWLDSLTSLTDAEWKIVIGHHPVYTGGARRDDVNYIRPSFEPVFAKNKVDAYFCGHEHDLQHMKAPNKPTHYFLSGAGSELRATGLIPESLFAVSKQGFMSVKISGKAMTVSVVDYEGNLLYTTTIFH